MAKVIQLKTKVQHQTKKQLIVLKAEKEAYLSKLKELEIQQLETQLEILRVEAEIIDLEEEIRLWKAR